MSAGKRSFELRAAAPGVLEILIYGGIGETWDDSGITAKEVAKELQARKGVRNILVAINSAGGNVFDGIAIYNLLAQHKARVSVSIDGMALSIASIVAMAGDTIAMAENALMMIHDPLGLVLGGAEDMRQQADLLDKAKGTLVTTYAKRTGATEEQVSQWMSAETWFNAEEAVEAGFADEVIEAKKIAATADLSKFKNVPAWVQARCQSIVALGDGEREAKDKEYEMDAKELEKVQAEAREQAVADDRRRLTELKAAFPDDQGFVLEQYEQGHGAIEAKAAFADVLAKRNAELGEKVEALEKQHTETQAKLTGEGQPALKLGVGDPGGAGRAADGGDGSATDRWNELVAKKRAAGKAPDRAVIAVNRENPGLRQEMLAECNAGRAVQIR